MTTQADDISIVFSGGATNSTASLSIGGISSDKPLTSGLLNNLFDDVDADESEGTNNYRCIYIFNDGDTNIYNIQLWIASEVSGGSSVSIGILTSSEIQRIRFTGTPTSGSINIKYEDNSFSFNYNTNLSTLASNLEDRLNSLTDSDTGEKLLRQVSVTAQQLSSTEFILDVDFSGSLDGEGQDDKRNHSMLTYVSDTLTPDTEISINVISEGSPINSVAELLEVETQVPTNVIFLVPTSVDPIILPKLRVAEGFPLWIKRTVPTDATPKENDGFTLRMRADSLNPLGD